AAGSAVSRSHRPHTQVPGPLIALVAAAWASRAASGRSVPAAIARVSAARYASPAPTAWLAAAGRAVVWTGSWSRETTNAPSASRVTATVLAPVRSSRSAARDSATPARSRAATG